MKPFDELVEDYAREPVPANQTVSGLRIALIIVGVAITLPAFLTGASLGQQLGLTRGLIAFVTGGLLVALVGAATGMVGAATGLATAQLVRRAFGKRGALVANLVLLAAFFGWFGVTVALFSQAANQAIMAVSGSTISPFAALLAGSVAMIAITIFGFKALDRLSLIAVPLMGLFLILLVYRTVTANTSNALVAQPPEGGSVGLAASAVAGAFMVGATMMPDLCRYARSSGHAAAAAFIAFAIGYPAVLFLAAIPAVLTGQTEMLESVIQAGLGISGFLMIVFASLTTNANNLYSSSLVLSALVPRISKWKLVVGAGIMGSAFAALGIMERLIDFLIMLGVVIPPIAGIVVCHHWVTTRTSHRPTEATRSTPALVAWLLACAVGFATSLGDVRLTGMPAIDSIVTAVGVYLVTHTWLERSASGTGP